MFSFIEKYPNIFAVVDDLRETLQNDGKSTLSSLTFLIPPTTNGAMQVIFIESSLDYKWRAGILWWKNTI